jgi:general secretion pathway protein J
MKIQTQQRAGGFTLLEIMVALFLLALVVAAVYSSWLAVVRGSETGRRAAAAVQRSRIAIRTIEDSLTSARSFQVDLDHYSFEAQNGSDASLSFVARLSKSFPRSGKFGDFDVRRLTFSLEPGPDQSQRLVLRQNPILMDLDIDEKEHPIVLAKDVKKFAMEFWDTRKGEWMDEWTETNSLPKMLRVTLEFGGDSPQSKIREEITRVIAVPTGTISVAWQGTPGGGGAGVVGGLQPPVPAVPGLGNPNQQNPYNPNQPNPTQPNPMRPGGGTRKGF